MNTLTREEREEREEAIDILISNGIFNEKAINEHNKASEFYIKHLIEGWDICDIDRMAHLNTLFGYDIGADNAMKIDWWLWDTDVNDIKDEYPMGYDTLELEYKDKEFVQHCVEKLGLDLSFDKWRTEDFDCYEYY